MRTVLIFLVILAPTSVIACKYWDAFKCGFKGLNLILMPDNTVIEKIDKRIESCNYVKECGQAIVDSSGDSERDENQLIFDVARTGCKLINRMYEDDFVSCAIQMEKYYWNHVCDNRTYNITGSNIYNEFFVCFGEYIRYECTPDQFQIFQNVS
ncbi:unnamed protein product [Caenorhabditis angaria]|uniref:DUF19 domain-containing protein n=1 Tax=Caenorhabditis angaria TaxID=860376 RepID=A0A9P1N1H8_9PELO|nr:unnamed protein product [Caenorhabditis angaria]